MATRFVFMMIAIPGTAIELQSLHFRDSNQNRSTQYFTNKNSFKLCGIICWSHNNYQVKI